MNELTEAGKLYTWPVEPLSSDIRLALQRLIGLEDVAHVAVMPDIHLAGEVCIGTVVGSREVLYPHAVGGDIGCGMVAVSTTLEADRLRTTKVARRLLDRLKMLVPVIKHGSQTAVKTLPEYLKHRPLSAPSLERQKHRDARIQLGSLGRGNHFLEFQEDDHGCIWVMVHTGSRSIGQLITRYHLKQATEGTTGLKGIPAETKAGRSYLNDVAWARHYATENRAAILEAVAVLLDSMFEVTFIDNSLITCDHNHVQPEIHQGVRLWVHRKGAVPAGVGQPGIIPGSMGSVSFHTLGKGCSHSLCSSSHGAGRLLSRTQASHQISLKALYGQMKGVIFDDHLAARLREEAPAAYKDIGKVMRAQRKLTRVVRRLRPVLSYKGI